MINITNSGLLEFTRAARKAKGNLNTARYDTGDVVQETFLRVCQDRAKNNGGRNGVLSNKLVYVILRRQATKLRRFHTAKKRSTLKDQALFEKQHPQRNDPATRAEMQEMAEQVLRRLKQLNRQQRRIVVRRIVDNATYSQIAKELNKNRFWVKTRFDEALRKLRRSMD